ncbi:MAG: hypothetical protein H6700_10110 [Myxococcales bacterium]|nr:hypothetical protein [Myxococcales bacterium]MCB9520703.1 hypothetical protein [Myxococcales bacterium]MCB9532107.1 hypothetical protein [Myxococcales bacterium]
MRIATSQLTLAGLLAVSTAAAAQEAPAGYAQALGAPAPGVEVPLQMSPGASQGLLQAAPPAASQAAAPAGAGAELEGVPNNERVVGLQSGSVAQGVPGSAIYAGVVPNETDSLPHISDEQARANSGGPNQLTWLGFQPFPDMTRVFIQTGRPAQYQVRESPDGQTITIRLRDTAIEMSNLRRDVDASYFGRVVQHVDAARNSDGVTEVIITLAEPAGRRVVAEGDYLYVDFAEPTY